MNEHYPALLIIVPLLSAFAISAAGWIRKGLCFPIALLGLGVSTYCAAALLGHVVTVGNVNYTLGGWEAPWGIVYEVDRLNALVLLVISVSAFLNLIGTHKAVEQEFKDRIGAFYTLYVLFVTGALGMVVTGDLFNLYVLLEVASLTSYAMIGLGKDRAPLSSLNYVFMGTMGGCFYLLGVGYLYIMTGSLNMADVSSLLPKLYGSTAILAAFAFCMVGVLVKMAFFPLHGWLPNAYTFAPSPVASLLAPIMTKVMVYVMIRLMISVFSLGFVFGELDLQGPMVWLSTFAIVAGAMCALTQRNLKRMLAYILVSEIGYMVGGVWLGNPLGMTGAILHILNDALMTLCVFMAAGNLSYRLHGVNLEDLRGVFRKMPVTMVGLVAGGLSIIGVPPTCGFFSKWYLIAGAMEARYYGFLVALILSSLINAVLFFRVIEVGYFEGEDHGSKGAPHGENGLQDAPFSMLVPLLLVAASLVFVGIYTGDIVSFVIAPVIPEGIR